MAKSKELNLTGEQGTGSYEKYHTCDILASGRFSLDVYSILGIA
ncbi:MAG: hypothetical protein WBB67_02645 [bacterium]